MKKPARDGGFSLVRAFHRRCTSGRSLRLVQMVCAPRIHFSLFLSLFPFPVYIDLSILLSFSYFVFAIHRLKVTSISLGTTCINRQEVDNSQLANTNTELRVASSCLGRNDSGFSRKQAVG